MIIDESGEEIHVNGAYVAIWRGESPDDVEVASSKKIGCDGRFLIDVDLPESPNLGEGDEVLSNLPFKLTLKESEEEKKV